MLTSEIWALGKMDDVCVKICINLLDIICRELQNHATWMVPGSLKPGKELQRGFCPDGLQVVNMYGILQKELCTAAKACLGLVGEKLGFNYVAVPSHR